jgi:hypothetical protein
MEAPAHLVETGEIALLPPDAPSRMTPAAEEKPVKKGKVAKSRSAVIVPIKFQYKVDKLICTVDELVAVARDVRRRRMGVRRVFRRRVCGF